MLPPEVGPQWPTSVGNLNAMTLVPKYKNAHNCVLQQGYWKWLVRAIDKWLVRANDKYQTAAPTKTVKVTATLPFSQKRKQVVDLDEKPEKWRACARKLTLKTVPNFSPLVCGAYVRYCASKKFNTVFKVDLLTADCPWAALTSRCELLPSLRK